jgi:hypothetical protein
LARVAELESALASAPPGTAVRAEGER